MYSPFISSRHTDMVDVAEMFPMEDQDLRISLGE